MRMMYFPVSDTGILGKNPSAPFRSRTLDHKVRGLVLGSTPSPTPACVTY